MLGLPVRSGLARCARVRGGRLPGVGGSQVGLELLAKFDRSAEGRPDGFAQNRTKPARLELVEGTYLVDVAAHRRDGTPYDYHRGLYSFRVKSRIKDVGVHRPGHEWTFRGAALTPPPPEAEPPAAE